MKCATIWHEKVKAYPKANSVTSISLPYTKKYKERAGCQGVQERLVTDTVQVRQQPGVSLMAMDAPVAYVIPDMKTIFSLINLTTAVNSLMATIFYSNPSRGGIRIWIVNTRLFPLPTNSTPKISSAAVTQIAVYSLAYSPCLGRTWKVKRNERRLSCNPMYHPKMLILVRRVKIK